MRNYSQTQGNLVLEGSFNDVMHHRLYFGRNDAGASLIPSEPFRLYSNGVGSQEKNISTGATVTLKECDTSQDGQGGTIPNGQAFVVAAIGIHSSLSNVQAVTPFADDADTQIDANAIFRENPIPLVEALYNQCTFELWKNSDIRLEKGVVNEYPSQFGLQGFAGGGTSTVARVQADVPAGAGFAPGAAYGMEATVLAQFNGMMIRELTVFQVLESLDQFYGVFQAQRPINTENTLLVGHIDFYLIGLLVTKDIARQFYTQFPGSAVSPGAITALMNAGV